MCSKNIEVEIRGPLTKNEFTVLTDFFSKGAVFKGKKERVLIDYSFGMQERNKDIRIRETNGIPEIIIKLGSWGGSESREEISISAEKNKFDTLVKIFGELGFTKGILCFRNIFVYSFKGIEFALVEIPNHSYLFEAEIVEEAEKVFDAEKIIRKVCDELNLTLFSHEDFFKYVEKLNKEANKIFDYKYYEEGYFLEKKYLKK